MKLKRLFVAVVALFTFGTIMAQQMPPVPVDPNVKIGKLDNGLTYYIRHNEYPEGVASFYIAQKVGSIQEEESQRGLAHLLEHLAFNGTDHFKDNDLQEYLQSIGVEYGRNLNAYTSIDQTVYYFTDVPTKRATAVDSCMMILKDWSNGISLTEKAINDERDVVHNEYRMRMVGMQRMLERSLPALYPDCKYGVRMPIGLMSVIDGCNPEAIRSYYRKWYRPDNQAIIIVGDIDVNTIETKIKELFSGIVVPEDAAKVEEVPVPDNEKAIYVVDKDKQQQADIILTFMKTDPMPKEMKGTMAYLMQNYMTSVLEQMLDERLGEKANDPDCPFLNAGGSYGDFLVSSTKDAFTIQTVAKPGKIIEAYEAVLKEVKRAKEFGFTATEYLRAKDEFMSRMEKAYDNREKMKNQEFTGQYVSHFISNEPIPSIEQEYDIYKQIVPMLSVDVINQVAQGLISFDEKNFVTFAALQEREGATYPTVEEFAKATENVRAAQLEAYVDNVKQEPLISNAPKAGKVKKITTNDKFGYKELALSNGAKVILKKTDYKDNEVQFYAWAKGGLSTVPQSQAVEASLLSQIASASGLGNFSNTELQKALAGKQASVGLSLGEYERTLNGNSTPKDIETLLQLIYLTMTDVSKDEKSVENLRQQYMTVLANQSNNPSLVYQDSVSSTLYPNNKFQRVPKVEDIQAIDYDRALSTIKKYFGNANDFTFMFVGNYDEETLLPLINTYIASLPGKGKAIANKQFAMAEGKVQNKFEKKMPNPQSQAIEYWRSAPAENTLRDRVTADIAGRILDMAYNRSIREELSAAYHAGADGGFQTLADGKMCYFIQGSAQLNPDKAAEAIPCFFDGMKKTIAEPNEEDMKKAKEILLKQADVNAKTNGYWVGTLAKWIKYGIDFHSDYKSTVSATTPKIISDFLQNVILGSGNHAEIIMNAVQE